MPRANKYLCEWVDIFVLGKGEDAGDSYGPTLWLQPESLHLVVSLNAAVNMTDCPALEADVPTTITLLVNDTAAVVRYNGTGVCSVLSAYRRSFLACSRLHDFWQSCVTSGRRLFGTRFADTHLRTHRW